MTNFPARFASIILAVALGLACVGQTRAAEADDQLVLTVNNTPYSHRQLFGLSAQELRTQFDKQVKDYTDGDLLAGLESTGYLRRHPEARAALAARAVLENTVFTAAYQTMLDSACRHLVLAHVGDEILRRHHAKALDYFNLDVLGAALSRQIALIDFLYDHQAEPASRNDALYAEANEKFGLNVSPQFWPTLREIVRRRQPWMRWSAMALQRSEQVDRYALRAILAHYLLQAACQEGGVYYDQAKSDVQFDGSELFRIRVSGYVGKPEVLQEYLSSVVDKDGDVALQGVSQLQLWLSGCGTSAHMEVDRALGGMMAEGANAPAVGVLSRLKPGSFEMLGWARKRDLLGATESQNKALAIFWTAHAYASATANFLPEVKSALSDWQPNAALLAEAVSVDGQSFLLPEIKVGPFIRQPYPAKPFAEFEHQRMALQEMAIRAALVVRKRDVQAASQLEVELAQRIGGSETEGVKSAYQALARRLTAELGPSYQTP